jgi:hypothetical protein
MLWITVDKFTQTEDGSTDDLVKKGEVIVASLKGDKTEYGLRGSLFWHDTLSDDARDALGELVSLHNDAAPGDDEVLGSSAQRKVGDTWDINAQAAAKQLRLLGEMIVTPSDISGSVTLAGVTDRDGVKCLDIRTTLDFNNPSPLDDSSKTQHTGRLRVKTAVLYPTDGASESPHSVDASIFSYRESTSVGGKPVITQTTVDRTSEATLSPVKTAAAAAPAHK